MKLIDLPQPELDRGDVMIRIHAAGVNPVDWKIREGYLQDAMPHIFPLTLGWDLAGTVVACGSQARGDLHVGDEVFAYALQGTVEHGTYAEYICLPAVNVARKPKSLSFTEAAAVPVAGLTAYQSLFDSADATADETVLIQAAAGGVGHFAVQLAKHAGLTVIGTAGTENQDFLRELGVDHPIDYMKDDVHGAVRAIAPKGVDIALDYVGGEVTGASGDLLSQDGGRIVSIANEADVETYNLGLTTGMYHFVQPIRSHLEKLAELIDSGTIRVHLSDSYALSQADQALKRQQAGHVRGKLALVI